MDPYFELKTKEQKLRMREKHLRAQGGFRKNTKADKLKEKREELRAQRKKIGPSL